MKNHNFRKLKAWQKGIELCQNIYSITKKLPDHEKCALASQMNRCAVSIPSNIAEGMSRKSTKDQSKFLDYNLGSSYELETQLIIVENLYPNSVKDSVFQELTKVQNYIGAFKRRISKNELMPS